MRYLWQKSRKWHLRDLAHGKRVSTQLVGLHQTRLQNDGEKMTRAWVGCETHLSSAWGFGWHAKPEMIRWFQTVTREHTYQRKILWDLLLFPKLEWTFLIIKLLYSKWLFVLKASKLVYKFVWNVYVQFLKIVRVDVSSKNQLIFPVPHWPFNETRVSERMQWSTRITIFLVKCLFVEVKSNLKKLKLLTFTVTFFCT